MPQALWTHCGFVYILSKIVFMFLHPPLSACLLFSSRVGTDEMNKLTFCFAVMKLKLRAVIVKVSLWWAGMHLISRASWQEEHEPLSEGYFIVCWSGARWKLKRDQFVTDEIKSCLLSRAKISRFFTVVFRLKFMIAKTSL